MTSIFYITENEISCYIKKPPVGCAPRCTMMMSQATAAGARMCQGTFFVLTMKKNAKDEKKRDIKRKTKNI